MCNQILFCSFKQEKFKVTWFSTIRLVDISSLIGCKEFYIQIERCLICVTDEAVRIFESIFEDISKKQIET